MCFNLLLKLQLSNDDKKLVFFYFYSVYVRVELIPLLQQPDLERLGVRYVGERIMLLNLAKGYESE